jgi:hypothetical protein
MFDLQTKAVFFVRHLCFLTLLNYSSFSQPLTNVCRIKTLLCEWLEFLVLIITSYVYCYSGWQKLFSCSMVNFFKIYRDLRVWHPPFFFCLRLRLLLYESILDSMLFPVQLLLSTSSVFWPVWLMLSFLPFTHHCIWMHRNLANLLHPGRTLAALDLGLVPAPQRRPRPWRGRGVDDLDGHRPLSLQQLGIRRQDVAGSDADDAKMTPRCALPRPRSAPMTCRHEGALPLGEQRLIKAPCSSPMQSPSGITPFLPISKLCPSCLGLLLKIPRKGHTDLSLHGRGQICSCVMYNRLVVTSCLLL